MIQVIDNIIPFTAQERLKQIVDDRDFRWTYRQDVTFKPGSGFPDFYLDERTSGYARSIYYMDEIDCPDMLPWCQQILDGLHDKTGMYIETLLRIQCNLMYQNPSKTFTKDSFNAAHTDQTYPHKVLLYYVNDSDGDTFIFNEKRGEEFDKLTIKQRVTPKQGRAVFFDGDYLHSSSNPLNSFKRQAINFNFV